MADQHPDYDTLDTFRKRFLKEIETLMVQVLMIARTLGLLRLGNIALDGSKIQIGDGISAIFVARFGERQRRAESGSDGVELETDVCLDGVDEGTKVE